MLYKMFIQWFSFDVTTRSQRVHKYLPYSRWTYVIKFGNPGNDKLYASAGKLGIIILNECDHLNYSNYYFFGSFLSWPCWRKDATGPFPPCCSIMSDILSGTVWNNFSKPDMPEKCTPFTVLSITRAWVKLGFNSAFQHYLKPSIVWHPIAKLGHFIHNLIFFFLNRSSLVGIVYAMSHTMPGMV